MDDMVDNAMAHLSKYSNFTLQCVSCQIVCLTEAAVVTDSTDNTNVIRRYTCFQEEDKDHILSAHNTCQVYEPTQLNVASLGVREHIIFVVNYDF